MRVFRCVIRLGSRLHQYEVYDVLDEMTAPLYHHIANLLAEPIDGTDARLENAQTKKAYLEVLVSIMTGRLYVVFVSESMWRFLEWASLSLTVKQEIKL